MFDTYLANPRAHQGAGSSTPIVGLARSAGGFLASESTSAFDLSSDLAQIPPKWPAKQGVRVANITSDADTARVGEYTWMCRTELDRERLVTTVRGVGKA